MAEKGPERGQAAKVRLAGWLRAIADYLDPFGSGDLDKMHAAGLAAMAKLNKIMERTPERKG